MKKILFVCTGNICRSPSADGILKQLAANRGMSGDVHVDSCGLQSMHAGEFADSRSAKAALKRGYDLSDQVSRQVRVSDFTEFDWVLALDRSHERALTEMAPPEFKDKVKLILPFSGITHTDEVPDPYYGGAEGFEHVLDLLEASCENLLKMV